MQLLIDVGAHIGQFNFFCQHYLKARKILSIEPVKDCFELLKLNSANSSDCLNCAISNEEKNLTMYIPQSSQESSYIKNPDEIYVNSFTIKTETLDNVMNKSHIDTCTLLKIDTEGSEYDVLLAAQKLLEKSDVLLIELSVYRASAGNLFTIGHFLQSKGVKLMRMLPRTNDPAHVDALFKKDEK